MWESMKLIEKANHFKKGNHHTVYPERFPAKNDSLKTLSFTVYSNGHLAPTQKNSLPYRSYENILPPIDPRNQPKKKRRSYRESMYHPPRFNAKKIDLSTLTARGTKSEYLTAVRENEILKDYEYQHAPPPSPSDDQIEKLIYEFTRAKNITPCSFVRKDGHVPYRLPALKNNRRTRSELTYPFEYTHSTLSNDFDEYY